VPEDGRGSGCLAVDEDEGRDLDRLARDRDGLAGVQPVRVMYGKTANISSKTFIVYNGSNFVDRLPYHCRDRGELLLARLGTTIMTPA